MISFRCEHPRYKGVWNQKCHWNGATEIDTVINISALNSYNDALVAEDIRAVVNASRGKALVKVIIEACLLTAEEKVRAWKLSERRRRLR